MPTEFYFEIQYFNSDWKITIILLHSHRNTQQWQVNDVGATEGKIWKSVTQKMLIYVHLNNVVLNFAEFLKIFKFLNFTEL